MALIVEDGTGIEDANGYLSQEDFEAYADAHGLSYAGNTDAEIGAALIRATVWLDAYAVQFGRTRSCNVSRHPTQLTAAFAAARRGSAR